MKNGTATIRQVPSRRLFGPKEAARYLGISVDTLRTYADLGDIPAYGLKRRRVFRLEDLDAFINSLPLYSAPGYTVGGGKPGLERSETWQ